MSQLDQVGNKAMDDVSENAGLGNGDVDDSGHQDMTDGANNLIAMAGTLVPVDRKGNEISSDVSHYSQGILVIWIVQSIA